MAEEQADLAKPENRISKYSIVDRVRRYVKYRRWREVQTVDVDFNIEDYLNSNNGPIVEIAGPTVDGYPFLGIDSKKSDILTSNINPGVAIFNTDTADFLGYEGKVDFQSDARHLPLKEESVLAVFASYLPNRMSYVDGIKYHKPDIFKEVHRVLKGNGILVLQGTTESELKYLNEHGFSVLTTTRSKNDSGTPRVDGVFIKSNVKQ